MKTKIPSLLAAGCLGALAAWIVHVHNPPHSEVAPAELEDQPKPARADAVPEKYRDTVHKGLEYLVKTQFKDGHWEGDGGNHPVAMTGLAGLALFMEKDGRQVVWQLMGRSLSVAKYSANIRKAADWLMDKSRAGRDGLIFSEHPSETSRYMEGHGLATLFLAGVCKGEHDDARRKKLTDVLIRAVKYIVKAQSTQGGWYHTSRVEGHDFDTISATAIQIQALQAAENAGIPVPDGVINDAQAYLEMALSKYEAAKAASRGRLAETAAALACRFRTTNRRFSRQGHTLDEWCKKWFQYCQAEIPVGRNLKFGRDELTHYYYAQAVCNAEGDAWSAYRTALFDRLQSSQNKDGSWPSASNEGIGAGPVYAAALWCTILQLDNESHPARLAGIKVR